MHVRLNACNICSVFKIGPFGIHNKIKRGVSATKLKLGVVHKLPTLTRFWLFLTTYPPLLTFSTLTKVDIFGLPTPFLL